MSNDVHGSQVIGVGIIGYGFMGRTHARAYQSAHRDGYPCRMLAVADTTVQALDQTQEAAGNIVSSAPEIDSSGITLLCDAQELIQRSDIALVSICTHTQTHVELAIQALKAGKHVLVEKPISLKPEAVRSLADFASQSQQVCVPAMCMRFWPAWVRVREIIESKQYGPVRSAVFHRLGSRPTWAADFYTDDTRTGGVLYDLHIHDTDFIIHCFGTPDAVTTAGDGLHLSTIYHYAKGPVHVLAQAAWDYQPSAGFQMRYTIVCEQATIDFDISRDDQLMIYHGDSSTPVDVGPLTGYDGEIRYVLDLISGQPDCNTTSMNDASMVASVLDAQRRSMEKGIRILLKQ